MQQFMIQFGSSEKQKFIKHPLLTASLDEQLALCWMPDPSKPVCNVFFLSRDAWQTVNARDAWQKATYLQAASRDALEHFEKCPCGDATLAEGLNVSDVANCEHGRAMFMTTLDERKALTENDMTAIVEQMASMRDSVLGIAKESGLME